MDKIYVSNSSPGDSSPNICYCSHCKSQFNIKDVSEYDMNANYVTVCPVCGNKIYSSDCANSDIFPPIIVQKIKKPIIFGITALLLVFAIVTSIVFIKNIKPQNIQLQTYKMSLSNIDETAHLDATVSPKIWKGDVVYKSSDNDVAIVDQEGNVTFVSSGDCVIKAIAGDVSTECKVSCVAVATDITLNTENIELQHIGDTFALNATISPDYYNGTVTYKSSDENVASVDDNGIVTSISQGNCVITAIADDIQTSCNVTCDGKSIVNSIKLSQDSIVLEHYGSTKQLAVKIKPSDYAGEISYKSSDKKIATVDENGNITAIDKGNCKITVKAGDSKAVCKVTVNNGKYELIRSDITWTYAKALCKQKGGHLATVSNKKEFNKIIDYISQYMKDNNITVCSSDAEFSSVKNTIYDIWFGGYYEDNKFKWVDGTKWKFENWYPGEPSHGKEQYLCLWSAGYNSNGWTFNDEVNDIVAAYGKNYSGKVAFLCEYD